MSIAPDTALRLSHYFGLTDRSWMNLQTRYDIDVEKDQLSDRLEREVRVFANQNPCGELSHETFRTRLFAVHCQP